MNNLNGFLNDFSSSWIQFTDNANYELNQFAHQVENKWEQLTSSLLVRKEQANQEASSSKRSLDSLDVVLDSGIFAKSILPCLAFKDHLSCLSVSKSWNGTIIKNTRFNPISLIPQEIFSNAILSLLNFKDVCSSLTVVKNWNECIVKYQIDKQATFRDLVELQSECNVCLNWRDNFREGNYNEYLNNKELFNKMLIFFNGNKDLINEIFDKQSINEMLANNGMFDKQSINEMLAKQSSTRRNLIHSMWSDFINLSIESLKNKMKYLIEHGHFQELKDALCEMCLTNDSPLYDVFRENEDYVPMKNSLTICFDFLINHSLDNHLIEEAFDLIFKKLKIKNIKTIIRLNMVEDDLFKVINRINCYFSEQDLRNEYLEKRFLPLIESIEKELLGYINSIPLVNSLDPSEIEKYKDLLCIGVVDEREIEVDEGEVIHFLSNFIKTFHFNSFMEVLLLHFLSSLLNQAAEKDYLLSLGTGIIKHSEITLALRKKREMWIQLMKENMENFINVFKEWEQKDPGAASNSRGKILNYESNLHATLRQLFDEGVVQAHYFGDSSS